MENRALLDWIHSDFPEDGLLMDILGSLPPRWGRMDVLSRLAVVAVGQTLKAHALLDPGSHKIKKGQVVGLVAATTRGSFVTDLEFCKTFSHGGELASPLLFGYTLANIPLAEAASHFGMEGPVFAFFDTREPFARALDEAALWLEQLPGLDAVVAGHIDVLPHEQDEKVIAKFEVVI